MRYRSSLLLLSIALLGFGCFGGPPYQSVEQSGLDNKNVKVQVEAYLFDARLKRDGKPTSVRLRILDRGDLIALGGRGYLGKGALTGWLSEDSIKVYFPSTNEFVYEPIESLINSSGCADIISEVNLFSYFKTLPDSISGYSDLYVDLVKEQKKKREYKIRQPGCSWQIDLTYDRPKNNIWRVKKFFFDNGDGTTLSGKRREYKTKAKVKASYFSNPVPPGAVRISP